MVRSIREWSCALAALLLLTQAAMAQNAPALIDRADDHYFNLEYDEAIRAKKDFEAGQNIIAYVTRLRRRKQTKN